MAGRALAGRGAARPERAMCGRRALRCGALLWGAWLLALLGELFSRPGGRAPHA